MRGRVWRVGASVVAGGGLVAGIYCRSTIRLWALRTLAHGGPVMMNVTIEDGTVKVQNAVTFGYFYGNQFLRQPGPVLYIEVG